MIGSTNDFEVVRGSGNLFADLGDADAAVKAMKAIVAADLIATLDMRGLSTRAAGKVARLDAADVQRIRNADLSRFTIDRLVRIASRLGRSFELRAASTPADVAG